jgi:hypothetical protein
VRVFPHFRDRDEQTGFHLRRSAEMRETPAGREYLLRRDSSEDSCGR